MTEPDDSELDDVQIDALNWGEDSDDDYSEPVGSCEQCGVNLYEEDDDEYCDQCLWRLRGGM